jgi:hypothetical protein
LWYSLNHLEYIGYGNVAPAPFSVVCPTAGSARATHNSAMRRITRRFLLINLLAWFYPEIVTAGLQSDEFMVNGHRNNFI